MNTEKVTRFEIIDHVPCQDCQGEGEVADHLSWNEEDKLLCQSCAGRGYFGREVVFNDKNRQLDVELQDDGRTLKVFIHERYEDEL